MKCRDVNKDLTPKNLDKDKDMTPKDQDKEKDLTPKDQDQDKDLTPKDNDKDLTPKDKDLKYVLKESLRTRTRINITDVCALQEALYKCKDTMQYNGALRQ